MKSSRLVVLASIFASVAGCGGGGSNEAGAPPPPAPTPVSAEGAWSGTLTSSINEYFDLFVLEDGSYWFLYGNVKASNGKLQVEGFAQGTDSVSASTFTSTDMRDFPYWSSVSANLSATLVQGASIAGSVSGTSGNATFSGTPVAGAYVYDTSAKVSDIAGSWTVTTISETLSLSIDSTGSISGTVLPGCSVTGRVTPRNSQKNIFDLSIAYNNGSCMLATEALSGIAVLKPLSDGTHELEVAMATSDRTRGVAGYGTR